MFVLMGLSTENSENYQSSSIVREIREKEREKEWIYAWEQNRGRDEGERRLTSVSIKMSTGDKVCSTKRRRRGFHYFPSLFLHDEFFPACKLSKVLKCVFWFVIQGALMAFTTRESNNHKHNKKQTRQDGSLLAVVIQTKNSSLRCRI